FFELIQIIPSPAKAALNSGNLLNYRISEPRIMGYLRNNSMFAFGKADRAKTSATMREILDSMWLFNDIFERALAKFGEIKAPQKGCTSGSSSSGGNVDHIAKNIHQGSACQRFGAGRFGDWATQRSGKHCHY